MNKVFLTGRLTKDVELRYTTNNTPVAQFSLAVNRDYTNQNGEREADFINIVVWKKSAENCSKYLNKGSKIAVDGKIQTRKYQNQDGNNRYITEVIAERVEFLDTKKKETQNVTNSEEKNPFEEMSEIVEQDIDVPF